MNIPQSVGPACADPTESISAPAEGLPSRLKDEPEVSTFRVAVRFTNAYVPQAVTHRAKSPDRLVTGWASFNANLMPFS